MTGFVFSGSENRPSQSVFCTLYYETVGGRAGILFVQISLNLDNARLVLLLSENKLAWCAAAAAEWGRVSNLFFARIWMAPLPRCFMAPRDCASCTKSVYLRSRMGAHWMGVCYDVVLIRRAYTFLSSLPACNFSTCLFLFHHFCRFKSFSSACFKYVLCFELVIILCNETMAQPGWGAYTCVYWISSNLAHLYAHTPCNVQQTVFIVIVKRK